MDNCFITIKKVFELLKLNHTDKYLKECILSHPDHPSLLSIVDTMDKYDVKYSPVKFVKSDFQNIPTPAIIQVIKYGQSQFYVLKDFDDKIVTYFNEIGEIAKEEITQFIKGWTGIVLLVEKTETSKEIDIEHKTRKNILGKVFLAILVLLLLAGISISIFGSSEKDSLLLANSIYAILKTIGLVTSIFLLWYEVDQYNPILQKFCASTKKVNCNAVLSSEYAYIPGTSISIGSLVFAYFFGSLSYLVIQGFSNDSLFAMGTVSFLTIPFIFLSFYYQAVVIKNWCKFCLIIQGILLFEVGTSIFFSVYISQIYFSHIILFLSSLLVPIIGWYYLKPLLENAKERDLFKNNLSKLKNNKTVFESLLVKSSKVSKYPNDLGIILKNTDSKYKVIKVCNPYCGPCADAHPILDALFDKGIIDLQIIFTAKPQDYLAKPVIHFLAIEEKSKNQVITKAALDDWYNSKNKDYDTFSKSYPMNGELELQDIKIQKMREWCDAEHIRYTPTIFIDGYKLPDQYAVVDLVNILL